jgi:hypothetical protein
LVAQDQPIAEAQHLAIHVQDGPAALVGDVGVLGLFLGQPLLG